ncbi:MAG: sigma factor-like helix-turn-helix DNA-binding protein [Bacillota bacterium]
MRREDLSETMLARAHQLKLSPQQEVIVRLIVVDRMSIGTVAKYLGTSESNVRQQLTKVRRKFEAYLQKQWAAALAEQARRRFCDPTACVLFMHAMGVKNKHIAQALGLEPRCVADIIYKNKGKRYVVVGTIPPRSEPKESQEFRAAFEEACKAYYRAFVAGNIPPESQQGQEILRALALFGVGGWPAKKLVLTDRASILKLFLKLGRVKRSPAAKATC